MIKRGQARKLYSILVGKLLRGPRKWEDNTEIDLREMGGKNGW
jgi:hypothetical protein